MAIVKKALANPIVERALHTFWQAALGAVVVGEWTHVAMWESAAAAGVAAALSAVKTAIVSG